MRTALCIVVVLFVGLALTSAQAQQPRIWQGVYTSAQADRGRATFTTTCLRCHGADLGGSNGPALKGDRFMTTWGGGSVTRVFEKIRDTMPPFATSTLDENTKLDIVTYILQSNGFPAGQQELAVADLESIQIVGKGEPPKAQNFARVQVVGCLARGDDNRFVLTSASDPVAAADNATVPVPAAGTGRVVLINSAPFNPEAQIGQRVEARGLVYRDERDTLLTVSNLKPLGPC